MSRLRRYGFLATIAIGMALLGASFHGLTSVDRELEDRGRHAGARIGT